MCSQQRQCIWTCTLSCSPSMAVRKCVRPELFLRANDNAANVGQRMRPFASCFWYRQWHSNGNVGDGGRWRDFSFIVVVAAASALFVAFFFLLLLLRRPAPFCKLIESTRANGAVHAFFFNSVHSATWHSWGAVNGQCS